MFSVCWCQSRQTAAHCHYNAKAANVALFILIAAKRG
ncbi:MAG: SEC-C metal-binding domain-containing protein [Gammaproteobacteria bacterium]